MRFGISAENFGVRAGSARGGLDPALLAMSVMYMYSAPIAAAIGLAHPRGFRAAWRAGAEAVEGTDV